jgi:hypothetical protein
MIREGYQKKNGTVLYFGEPLLHSCAETFQAVTCNFKIRDYYARDHAHVFYRDTLVRGADPATFEVISQWYARDCRTGYFYGKAIPNSHGPCFQMVADYYARDHKRVFFHGRWLKSADPMHFQAVGMNYFTDQRHVYYDGKAIKDADATSFLLIGGDHLATDKFAGYWRGKRCPAGALLDHEEVQFFFIRNKHLTDYWFFKGRVDRNIF